MPPGLGYLSARAKLWLTDACRLPWQLLYWNVRKSAFVLRGRRGTCPCQEVVDPRSQSGVQCKALYAWNEPARFRCVCPLLVRGADSWHCSARLGEIRPFWGRALLILATATVAVYLLGVSAVFLGLRAAGGKSITWVQVARPDAWGDTRRAQARDFFRLAMEAFRRRENASALVYLGSALERDPQHYESALLSAQTRAFRGSLADSDAWFESLLTGRPEHAAQTAIVFHDTLLGLNRPGPLADFCLRMAVRNPEESDPWIRSLLLALRAGRLAADFSASAGGGLDRLPEAARRLLFAEAAVQRGERLAARNFLLESVAGSERAFYVMLRIEMLARLGESEAAFSLLRRGAAVLSDFDRLQATYWIDLPTNDGALLRMDFEALLAVPMTAESLGRTVACLLEHPDPKSFRRLNALFTAKPELRRFVVGGEMWLAAIDRLATA